MQSVKHIKETRLSDNGLYEVTEVERQDSLEPEVVRLKEELASEREHGVRLLAEFDNYRRRTSGTSPCGTERETRSASRAARRNG